MAASSVDIIKLGRMFQIDPLTEAQREVVEKMLLSAARTARSQKADDVRINSVNLKSKGGGHVKLEMEVSLTTHHEGE